MKIYRPLITVSGTFFLSIKRIISFQIFLDSEFGNRSDSLNEYYLETGD